MSATKSWTAVACVLAVLGTPLAAHAASVGDMLGTWSWKDFVVEVTECDADAGICAKVIEGPKNVGMEMIRSELQPQDDRFVGKLAHPMTGEIYNSRLTLKDADTWFVEGCTDSDTCAEGTFERVK